MARVTKAGKYGIVTIPVNPQHGSSTVGLTFVKKGKSGAIFIARTCTGIVYSDVEDYVDYLRLVNVKLNAQSLGISCRNNQYSMISFQTASIECLCQ